ncbi:MAG TPA: hypothetical protein VK701_00725 [Solirubrobacteraceae bacterium]|nr:hypothetical protein [Solirubrobacteraceae bacterium]
MRAPRDGACTVSERGACATFFPRDGARMRAPGSGACAAANYEQN